MHGSRCGHKIALILPGSTSAERVLVWSKVNWIGTSKSVLRGLFVVVFVVVVVVGVTEK